MRSPICNLESYIAGVAFNIAPERGADMVTLRDTYGLTFELVDKKDSEDASENVIAIYVTTGVIRLPISALEYLWACTYHYWVVTQEYAAAQHSAMEARHLGQKTYPPPLKRLSMVGTFTL
jgi:hypothetical protein